MQRHGGDVAPAPRRISFVGTGYGVVLARARVVERKALVHHLCRQLRQRKGLQPVDLGYQGLVLRGTLRWLLLLVAETGVTLDLLQS